ncbi:glutamate--tRNA ligase [Agrococcus casei]|uniref:glutamate--tRNA ligase n=1 Tax=Agrococcus casei TaxID=343512 RepID=UPI003F920224
MSVPFSSATGSDVVVRFCPSPTGTPHVGLIRTALFNWAYARHTGGKMVFRIEDTDAARDSQESYEQLLEAMQWLGIDWDEGVETGGPNAPYRQSQRGDIYQEVIEKLKATGHLYESFITGEEMEERNKAAGRDPRQGYDNHERDLTDEQREAFKAEGRQPSLRLRVPDEDLSFTDLVRGEITFPAGSFTDFVVVRPNGAPLYTFVNPVDDALMGVTHVLRGEDLLSSTPRQIALYRALAEAGVVTEIPQFGHLPYVMGDGNKKLSKRDPQSNLFLLREAGFIPEGLLNYLSLLGWAIASDRDVFTRDELIAAFDVADVNPNPSRFDAKKAESINGDHVRMLAADDFAERLVPYLKGVFGGEPDEQQRALLAKAAPLVQERMQLIGQAEDMMGFLFVTAEDVEYDVPTVEKLGADAEGILAGSIRVLEELEEFEQFETGSIEAALRGLLIDEMELKPRVAFTALRVAVTGRKVSPPLFESMELLGRDETVARIRRLMEKL